MSILSFHSCTTSICWVESSLSLHHTTLHVCFWITQNILLVSQLLTAPRHQCTQVFVDHLKNAPWVPSTPIPLCVTTPTLSPKSADTLNYMVTSKLLAQLNCHLQSCYTYSLEHPTFQVNQSNKSKFSPNVQSLLCYNSVITHPSIKQKN